MLLTAIKKRINSKEWMQYAFVELVGDIFTIVLGLFLVLVFKTYIA